jgi:hypothetical protein
MRVFDLSQRRCEETQMRSMMTAIAALALCGLVAATSARAEEIHNSGGPVRAGNQCWVSTHVDKDMGYWKDCPAEASASTTTTTTKAHASTMTKAHASKTMKAHASKTMKQTKS